jgi:hypothetical protein
MLRASLLANAEILPQARQGSYFFNRIGRFQPVVAGSYRSRVCKNVVDQQQRTALVQTTLCVDAKQNGSHRMMGSFRTSARSFSKETVG